jgi:hypothetical protein
MRAVPAPVLLQGFLDAAEARGWHAGIAAAIGE